MNTVVLDLGTRVNERRSRPPSEASGADRGSIGRVVSVTGPEPNIANMWQAHRDRRFPPLLRGAEVGNIDVVQLDADTAGCVSTWLADRGHLDPDRTRILTACMQDLDTVLAVLTDGEERYYLQQLRILATAVLARTA